LLISVIFTYYKDFSTEFDSVGVSVIMGWSCISLILSAVVLHYILMIKELIRPFKVAPEAPAPEPQNMMHLRYANSSTIGTSSIALQMNMSNFNRPDINSRPIK
jgi:hypothetical protein